jgi:hypothetical protein
MRFFCSLANGHLGGLFRLVLLGALERLIAENFVLFGTHCVARVR